MLNFIKVEPQEKYLCLGSKQLLVICYLLFVICFTPFGANDFFCFKGTSLYFCNTPTQNVMSPGERAIPPKSVEIVRGGVEIAAAPTNTRLGELNSNFCSKSNTTWVSESGGRGRGQRQLQAKAIFY